MEEIDTTALLNSLKIYLPESAIKISDEIMLQALNQVVSVVGNSTENLPEIQCKGLRAIAQASKAITLTQGNIKREEVFQEEVEYFNNYDKSVWDEFEESLTTLCPVLFGYSGLNRENASLIRVGVADPIRYPSCSQEYGLTPKRKYNPYGKDKY